MQVKIFHFTWSDVIGETEYRLLESADGISPLAVVATIAANATNYDLSVPLFRRLGARYVLRACNGSTCSDSQPVAVAPALAGAVGYFKASNTEAGDTFGWSVALSADGTTLAVGADREASNATGIGGNQADNSEANSGAVFVFSRSGTGWVQQAYVKASNTGAGDDFGGSVALSADGNTLAVGAAGEASNATGIGGIQTDNSTANSGAVYVFSRSGTAWAQQAYVKASNTGPVDLFGRSVALSADGTTLAVGAPNEDSNSTGPGGNQADNSATNSGAVYVFSRSGSAWAQQAYLKASNTGAGDMFGGAVALSADGNLLSVGAASEDSNATGVGGSQTDNSSANSGAVYVFSRTGTAWAQQAYVKSSNTEAADLFGISVALSADGTTLAVGASSEDSNATGVGGNQADNSATGSGAVYVFFRNGTAWTQQAYVKTSNSEAFDGLGAAVSLSADGALLACGATGEDSNAAGVGGSQTDNSAGLSGAVYVFSRTGGTWTQQAYVKPSNTEPGDFFGASVALSADGTTLGVGDREASSTIGIGGNQNDNTAAGSGAVFVY